jgi:pantoate--beta-alanine ligase
MAVDLNMPLSIVEVPTVRENDGLAVSSRNVYLDAEQRRSAAALYQSLTAARELVAQGEREAAAIKRGGLEVLARQPAVRVEYFEVVDSDEMQPVERVEGPVRVAAAVWVGSTRLIDNVLVEV